MNQRTKQAKERKAERIRIIESSQSASEAAYHLGIETTTLYHWLSNNGLKITYDNHLKVVSK